MLKPPTSDHAPPRGHTGSRARIGLIAGSGPEAGIDLWAKLLQANRTLLGAGFGGDADAPSVVVVSEPALGLSMELDQHHAAVWATLERVARQLAPQVDHYAIACNTLNVFEPQLQALALPARFLSFGAALLQQLRAERVQRVALLAARPVLAMGRWSHYRTLAEQVEVELPTTAAAEALHQLIYDVKAHGGTAPGIAERLAGIVHSLQSDVVLLACTELPLIPRPATPKRLLDVTEVVAARLALLSLTPTPKAPT
jgi:aspartate racemase